LNDNSPSEEVTQSAES